MNSVDRLGQLIEESRSRNDEYNREITYEIHYDTKRGKMKPEYDVKTKDDKLHVAEQAKFHQEQGAEIVHGKTNKLVVSNREVRRMSKQSIARKL